MVILQCIQQYHFKINSFLIRNCRLLSIYLFHQLKETMTNLQKFILGYTIDDNTDVDNPQHLSTYASLELADQWADEYQTIEAESLEEAKLLYHQNL